MRCCTVLEIVPIPQPGSSSSLSLPSSRLSSSSSSSSPSSPSSELTRSLGLSPIAFNISSNVVSGLVVVNPVFSAFLNSSCACSNAVCASSTRFLATAVSLSTYCSIHISIASLLKHCVSCRLPAASFFSDRKLHNAARARTLSGAEPLLPSFAWWRHRVEGFVDLPSLPAGNGERFFSEHWPLYFVLTLLMDKMLDVARYGPHRGKLRLLCRGWYASLTWTKHNLDFDHHWIGNSNANRTSFSVCLM